MKLSNTQYKFLTRLGLVLAIAAALCYDRVDRAYRPVFIAVAIIAGVVGFFPLFTSRAFDSSEDPEAAANSESALESVQLTVGTSPAEVDVSDRSLDRYIQHLYSTVNAEVQLHEYFAHINDLFKVTPAMSSYTVGGFQESRSERVREMCEVVSKLGAMPQEFSVELTSEDSIIVHCQPAKAAYSTESVLAENWHHEDKSTKQEMVH